MGETGPEAGAAVAAAPVTVTATDLKQWAYCPRIPFFRLVFFLVKMTLAAIPAAVNSYLHPEPASRVELVNVDQLRDVVRQVMSESQEKPAQSPPQPAPPAPAKPAKPQGPPNHEIREGQQPPPTRR